MNLKFFTDPGHGWLAVHADELRQYNLINKVSKYSYMNLASGHVYLEEDVDAPMFMNRAKTPWVEIDTFATDKDSVIRSFPRYEPEAVWNYVTPWIDA